MISVPCNQDLISLSLMETQDLKCKHQSYHADLTSRTDGAHLDQRLLLTVINVSSAEFRT